MPFYTFSFGQHLGCTIHEGLNINLTNFVIQQSCISLLFLKLLIAKMLAKILRSSYICSNLYRDDLYRKNFPRNYRNPEKFCMLTLKIVGDPVNFLTAGHCSKLFHGAAKINSYLNTKTLICDLPLE
jgi:hypothetical protein